MASLSWETMTMRKVRMKRTRRRMTRYPHQVLHNIMSQYVLYLTLFTAGILGNILTFVGTVATLGAFFALGRGQYFENIFIET